MASEVPDRHAPAGSGLSQQRLADDHRALQAMAGRMFSAQEAERRMVARGLHNGAGQAVTAIRMAASAAMAEADQEQLKADLDGIIAQADAALGQLREISNQLRPPQLDALGLEAALRWHAGRVLQDACQDAPATVRLEMDELQHRPAQEAEQACFRIAEEALANALQHAGAATITLGLRDAGDGVLLEIRDDGRGFDPEQVSGPGLVGMRERARSVGAEFSITSAPQRGTRISAHLPCP